MKSKLAIIAVSCLLATAAAQEPWDGESPRPRALVYGLEGLGALGGVACAGGCGGAAALVAAVASGALDPDHSGPGDQNATSYVFYSIAAICAAALPAATGSGAVKAGEQLGENGSPVGAFVGAYVGMLAGIGVGLASRNNYYGRWMNAPLFAVVGLGVPIGAVVGYNVGGSREPGLFGSRYHGKLGLPALALTSTELPDHSVEYGVKVQLAGLRF